MRKCINFGGLREKLDNPGRTTIYRHIEAGRLPSGFMLGGRRYWFEDEIDAALEAAARQDAA